MVSAAGIAFVPCFSASITAAAALAVAHQVALRAALVYLTAFWSWPFTGPMGETHFRLATAALVIRTRSSPISVSQRAGVPLCRIGLLMAELPHGGCLREAAFARRDVGQPARLWEPVSSGRDGVRGGSGEPQNYLGVVAVFDHLCAAARAAQFRVCNRPPSCHSDQPDDS